MGLPPSPPSLLHPFSLPSLPLSIFFSVGIFSDIHMLSLMYSGDMCYWAWVLTVGNSSPLATPIQLHPPTKEVANTESVAVSQKKHASADPTGNKENRATSTNVESSAQDVESWTSVPGEKPLSIGVTTPDAEEQTDMSAESGIDLSSASDDATAESAEQGGRSLAGVLEEQTIQSVESGRGGQICKSEGGDAAACSVLVEQCEREQSMGAVQSKPNTAENSGVLSSVAEKLTTERKCAIDEQTAESALVDCHIATPPGLPTCAATLAHHIAIPESYSLSSPPIPSCPWPSSASSAGLSPPKQQSSPSPPIPSWPSPASSSDPSPFKQRPDHICGSPPLLAVAPDSTGIEAFDLEVTAPDSAATDGVQQEPLGHSPPPLQDARLSQETTILFSRSVLLAEGACAEVSSSDDNITWSSSFSSSDLYPVLRHTHGKEVVSQWVHGYDPLEHGLKVLSKYIKVARGPLKDVGWDYTRAVKLMLDLKKGCVTVGK